MTAHSYEIIDESGKRLGYFKNKSAATRCFNRNYRGTGASVRPTLGIADDASQLDKPARAIRYVDSGARIGWQMLTENGWMFFDTTADAFCDGNALEDAAKLYGCDMTEIAEVDMRGIVLNVDD